MVLLRWISEGGLSFGPMELKGMTIKQYLVDDALSGPARIVEKVEADVPIIRLDRTLFHPNTANQRADRGSIGQARVLSVEDNRGIVDHYVDRIADMSVGDSVEVAVDESWRFLQSTYHSAGHIVAYALKAVRQDCNYFLGRHWPDHAVINCRADQELSPHEVDIINRYISETIDADLPLKTYVENGDRYVVFGNLRPVCCYGTHLKSTGLLRRVEVVRNEFDGSELQVQYVAYRAAKHERKS